MRRPTQAVSPAPISILDAIPTVEYLESRLTDLTEEAERVRTLLRARQAMEGHSLELELPPADN